MALVSLPIIAFVFYFSSILFFVDDDDDEYRKKQARAEDEEDDETIRRRRQADGTPVTRESFTAWKVCMYVCVCPLHTAVVLLLFSLGVFTVVFGFIFFFFVLLLFSVSVFFFSCLYVPPCHVPFKELFSMLFRPYILSECFVSRLVCCWFSIISIIKSVCICWLANTYLYDI